MKDLLQGIMYDENDGGGSGSGDKETEQPYKSFANENDYKKELQSTSSKAKNELLKEFGVSSVDEFKKGQEDFKAFKATQLTDQEKYQAQLGEKDTAIEALNKQLLEKDTAIEKNSIVNEAIKLGINPAKIDDAIKLATFGDDKDYKKGLEGVITKYPSFKGEGKQHTSAGFGKGKTLSPSKKDGATKKIKY